ncbi:MAG: hypothetical protein JSS21_01265 [Proteobacteria bacterium]|nr:hypothetical protein [Pseudomonadota bacterium]
MNALKAAELGSLCAGGANWRATIHGELSDRRPASPSVFACDAIQGIACKDFDLRSGVAQSAFARYAFNALNSFD